MHGIGMLGRVALRRATLLRQPITHSLYFPARMCHAMRTSSTKAATRPVRGSGAPAFVLPSLSDRIMYALDLSGTVAFALTGSVAAAVVGMDSLGCTIVGTITAVGGGTVRNAILGQTAFWIIQTEYLWLCLASAGAAFVGYRTVLTNASDESIDEMHSWLDGRAMMLWDAFGVGAFAVIGAKGAKSIGRSPIICVVCGMITATFGGMTRDVLTQQKPRILYSNAEIYATTALGGASVYLLLGSLGVGQLARNLAGVFTSVGLRTWAFEAEIRLPVVPMRPAQLRLAQAQHDALEIYLVDAGPP